MILVSAKFAGPSPPTACRFAVHPRDQPGGEGLAARLAGRANSPYECCFVLLVPHEYSDCIHQGDMQRERVGKAHKDSGYIDRHDCRIVY